MKVTLKVANTFYQEMYFTYACNLQNTSVIYWITEILMHLMIGTHQRGATYNVITNHNSKCMHTYLVCNTVLLNACVCKMYSLLWCLLGNSRRI